MIERLNSLRVWLLLAMLGTAAVAILAGNLVVDRVNAKAEIKADRAKALLTAHAIAAHVEEGDSVEDLRVLQQALPNDQIVVFKHGSRLFTGPTRSGQPLEVSVTARSRDATVILRDHHAPDTGGLRQISLVAGGLAALIIAEAWIGATLLMRTVHQPLRRAIETADRVAAGDLSARMGSSGPEELARLGHAFDRMADQLERADEEQRRFLADLTHEIATPVSAIAGFAMALADGSTRTAEARTEATEIVLRETHRLNQLLASARSLHQLDHLESTSAEPVELLALCAEAAQRFRHAARQAGVTLEVEGDQLVASTDPRCVETVIDNLLSNALRHTSPGGHVRLSVVRHHKTAVIAVRDSGEGIAPEHLHRIFDRLYRGDDARERRIGGSGLGLAIARRAAQTIGGRLEVDSTPGTGSEFRLYLGLSPNALLAPKTGVSNASAGGPSQGKRAST